MTPHPRSAPRWTPEELRLLLLHYVPHRFGAKHIARFILPHRTPEAVYVRLGLIRKAQDRA